MTTACPAPLPVPRVTSLAACLAAALALAAPAATAVNRVVLNCNDSGSNSLRDIVTNHAVDGDTIDLSQLPCSAITLTTGEIPIIVNNLTLTAGPGVNSAVTIDGGFSTGHHNRVITHVGTGKLTIRGLLITDAKYDTGSAVEGGCILSSGEVDLIASTVSHCKVQGSASNPNSVVGGGIYAFGDVHLLASTVTSNTAQAFGSANAGGGGIYSRFGNVVVAYSTISQNTAVAAATRAASGGGLSGHYSLNISYSTISGNKAQVDGGIGIFHSGGGSNTAVITNSTISGNSGSDSISGVGGVYVNVPLTLSNSTIAFNTSPNSHYGAGLSIAATTANLQSSIIADNLASGVPNDIYAVDSYTGANNLIYKSNRTVTIGKCPKLAPLADNGASTQTHALLLTSPAIDKGNNVLGLTADERGDPFHRIVGVAADIGAYEWQGGSVDRIFKNGFEAGCDE